MTTGDKFHPGERVLCRFRSQHEAMTWARESAAPERTRYLVTFNALRHRHSGDGWLAIQKWLDWAGYG